MAFRIRDLSVLAYAQGFTLWHYKSAPDTLDAVARPGFFDNAADMLAGGDMMLVSSTRWRANSGAGAAGAASQHDSACLTPGQAPPITRVIRPLPPHFSQSRPSTRPLP